MTRRAVPGTSSLAHSRRNASSHSLGGPPVRYRSRTRVGNVGRAFAQRSFLSGHHRYGIRPLD
jgi:hypothetical protein